MKTEIEINQKKKQLAEIEKELMNAVKANSTVSLSDDIEIESIRSKLRLLDWILEI